MAMKVLLKEDVSGLGTMGEVVNVADGYARNFLLPRSLATKPSDGALKEIDREKKRRAQLEVARVADLKKVAERIGAIDVTLKERVADDDKLYGAVAAKEIVAALAEEGITVAPDSLILDDPIKTLGVHRVPIKLHADVIAELKVWVVELKGKEGE